jgi:hypothetical protein
MKKESTKTKWTSKNFAQNEQPVRSDFVEMFLGEIPGIQIQEVLPEKACRAIVKKINTFMANKARSYKGDLNIGTVLNFPSHWELEYIKGGKQAWQNYFKKVKTTNQLRKELFSECGDPIFKLQSILRKAWNGPVHVAKHPTYKKDLYAGLIRSGAPRLHFDWGRYDLPGLEIVAQAGANIPLSNFQRDGDLVVYRKLGMERGKDASSGSKVVGNYDLPHDLVANVESHKIEYGIGDLIIAPNRFLHEVTDNGQEPQTNRILLSVHVAWMGDGSLALFS